MKESRSVVVARQLATLTDRAFRIPFTRIEFGLDAIMGLVPGAGDALGALLSAYVVVVGMREGVSGTTLLRMLGNIALETIVGVVPLLGDVFDAGWKANVRNVMLIDEHLEAPERQRRANALMLCGTLLGLAAAASFAVWSALWIVGKIVDVAVAIGGAAV